jgi:hypothetical protein
MAGGGLVASMTLALLVSLAAAQEDDVSVAQSSDSAIEVSCIHLQKARVCQPFVTGLATVDDICEEQLDRGCVDAVLMEGSLELRHDVHALCAGWSGRSPTPRQPPLQCGTAEASAASSTSGAAGPIQAAAFIADGTIGPDCVACADKNMGAGQIKGSSAWRDAVSQGTGDPPSARQPARTTNGLHWPVGHLCW